MALHRRLGERLLPTREADVDLVSVLEPGRHVAAKLIDLTRRVAERPCRDPDRSPERHRLDCRGFCDPAMLVTSDHLEAHLVPPYGAEIQVHVWRVLALLVQEPLEEEPVAERLGLGQPQAVGDQTVRGAPPARHGDALSLRDLPGLVRDQEVRREPQSLYTG